MNRMHYARLLNRFADGNMHVQLNTGEIRYVQSDRANKQLTTQLSPGAIVPYVRRGNRWFYAPAITPAH